MSRHTRRGVGPRRLQGANEEPTLPSAGNLHSPEAAATAVAPASAAAQRREEENESSQESGSHSLQSRHVPGRTATSGASHSEDGVLLPRTEGPTDPRSGSVSAGQNPSLRSRRQQPSRGAASSSPLARPRRSDRGPATAAAEFNDPPRPRQRQRQSQHHGSTAVSQQQAMDSQQPDSSAATAAGQHQSSATLRSLTPSSSLPNFPSQPQGSESVGPEHQTGLATSASSSTLSSSHSYPFLAEPPPERASIRQKRRMVSMPTSAPGRRRLSRSPPPPAAPLPALRSPRSSVQLSRTVSSSSSLSKRGREDPTQQPTETSVAIGQAPSKRRASGSRRPSTGKGKKRADEGSDEDEPEAPASQRPAPPMTTYQGRRYELIIVQEPTRGCAFGSNLLSRLPCAPPLIVQLRVTDESGNEISSDAEEPFLVCHTSLLTSEGQAADLLSPVSSATSPPQSTSSGSAQTSPEGALAGAGTGQSPQPAGLRRSSRASAGAGATTPSAAAAAAAAAAAPRTPTPRRVRATPVRMLYGSLAATAQKFTSPQEGQGVKTYFMFAEVCVRARGTYQLKLSLMKLPRRSSDVDAGAATAAEAPPPSSSSSSASDLLATTTTSPFEVFLAHEYVAPYVTDTTRYFARQGAALPLPPGDRSMD